MSLPKQIQAANEERAKNRSSYLPDPVVFKKGAVRADSIHEEPTLVSFFFNFHWEDSKLFKSAFDSSGKPNESALNFFESTLANTATASSGGKDFSKTMETYSATKAAELKSFTNILKKINTQMPWFFQTLTGLEIARNYNDEEPWRGVDKPKIEIECLEENIELTATKLMSLYRSVVWDSKRNIRILPANVCKFTMDIYITEVRSFQANTASPLLSSNRGSTAYTNLSNQDQDGRRTDQTYANGFLNDEVQSPTVGVTKPVFAIRLKHCEFDMNSGQELFSDLGKNPEMKKPKIGIYYKTAEVLYEYGGPNLPLDKYLKEEEILSKGSQYSTRDPYDPNDDKPKIIQAISNIGKDAAGKVADAVSGAVARAKNLTKFTNGNSTIGNAHGVKFTGAVGNIVDAAIDNVGSVFLDNVYGLNAASTLQDAINSASINALGGAAALVGKLKTNSGANSKISPSSVYDNLNVGQSLGGSISPKNIYDGIDPNTLDSTPDIGIKDNVYGTTPAIDLSLIHI